VKSAAKPKSKSAQRSKSAATTKPKARPAPRPASKTRPVAPRSAAGPKPAKSFKESATDRIARTREIVARLEAAYPDAHCALLHHDPLQLLIATILSAQCTDARVNIVTPGLFARYPDARAFAEADPLELEEMIRSTGFFHNKARNILGCAQALMMRYGGQVPADLVSLVELPGVGRKTANVVLGNAFDIPGVVVDTHVTRLTQLLRLTSNQDPNKIELDLMELVPREKWTLLAHLLIEHGRRVCKARSPQCAACVLNDICPSSRV
jgi:endonuclease-3